MSEETREGSSGNAADTELDALIEEFIERHRRGEQGLLTELARRQPELEARIRDLFPALVDAAHTIGAVQTRNLGTLGGNLVTAVPSVDSGPTLVALDAVVTIFGPGGQRQMPLADFFVGPRKTALKPGGREAISSVASVLATIEGRKFQVTGHTDNVPIRSSRFKSNWELSAARAVEVVKVMIAAGLAPTRLSAAGYADQLPIAGNEDAVGRLQNRRIEIVVMPNLEELPAIDAK